MEAYENIVDAVQEQPALVRIDSGLESITEYRADVSEMNLDTLQEATYAIEGIGTGILIASLAVYAKYHEPINKFVGKCGEKIKML